MKKYYITLIIALLSSQLFAQSPSWAWAKRAGGSSDENGYAIATDAAGDVYVTGYFRSGTIAFGATTLTNAGNASITTDMFLVKYSATGGVIWAKSAGGTGDETGNAIAVDAAGNIYVTGYFTSTTLTVGATTLTNAGGDDMYIIKYDTNGNVLWAKKEGGGGTDVGNAVATDAAGNVFVTGRFNSLHLIAGTTTLNNAGGYDSYVIKYTSAGAVVWLKQTGGNGDEYGNAIATDTAGNVYTAGYFTSPTLTLGTSTITNVGNEDAYLIKYNATGAVLLAKSTGGTGNDVATSMATDMAGYIYVAGRYTSRTMMVDTIALTNVDTSGTTNDLYLIKYDATGTPLWTTTTGGDLDDYANSVVTDATGNIYVTGKFASTTIDFGVTALTNAGSNDMFIAKYDATGAVLWAKSAGGTGDDNGHSVAINAAGDVYLTGAYDSPSLVFGSTTLTQITSYDVFVAKLADVATGIQTPQETAYLTIAPNPFTTSTTLTFNNDEWRSIKIIDVLGNELKTVIIKGARNLTIEKGEMKTGVYFVQITDSNKKIINKKIVVQ